jgi:hypothetical protein
MNPLYSPGLLIKACAGLVATIAALVPFTASAQVSPNDYVRIEGRVQTEQDRKDLKGTTVDEVTQGKTLFITISGKPKTPETRTGTWTLYGRDLKGHDIEVLEHGDFKVDLSAGPQKVESKKASTTYTPEHAGGGKKGNGKKVEAEGKRFAGYVVTVKDGDKVVGQLSDPPGLQGTAK